MNANAEDYAKFNQFQFEIYKNTIIPNVVNYVGPLDIILDVGCGDGRCTYSLYATLVEKLNFKGMIIGMDIEPTMIAYAIKKFATHDKHNDVSYDNSGPSLNFLVCDISKPLQEIKDKLKVALHSNNPKVDHIVSAFCMHWINDQHMALSNLYNLLNINTNTTTQHINSVNLLFYIETNAADDACQKILRDPKWNPYTEKLKEKHEQNKLPWRREWMHEPNPTEYYKLLMVKAGFNYHGISVQAADINYPWKRIEELALFLKVSFPKVLPYELMDPTNELSKTFFTEFAQYTMESLAETAKKGEHPYIPLFHYNNTAQQTVTNGITY